MAQTNTMPSSSGYTERQRWRQRFTKKVFVLLTVLLGVTLIATWSAFLLWLIYSLLAWLLGG
ncbi:hypothetical protein GPNCGGLF_LOCUS4006 [Methylorubrum aminovorans]